MTAKGKTSPAPPSTSRAKKGRDVSIGVRLDAELHEQLVARAALDDRGVVATIRHAIKHLLACPVTDVRDRNLS